jgi:DNA-binding MarR family transcriptional regulator
MLFVADTVSPASSPTAGAQSAAVGEVLDAFGELLVAQRRLRGRDARHTGELSFAQARVLAELEDDAGCPASKLAEKAGMTPASVTCMLDTLEHKGLVTRVRSERDRRIVLTHLTDRGRRLRDHKRAEARRIFEDALATLDPAELAATPRALRLLAAVMEAM